MDSCVVKMYKGTPTLHINGKPVFAPMLTTNKNPKPDRWVADPYFMDFTKAGFNLFQIDVNVCSFDATYDIEKDEFVEEKFKGLDVIATYAKMNPNCKFVLRISDEPRGDGSAWLKAHSDQAEIIEDKAWNRKHVREDGTIEYWNPYKNPSYASDLWVKDAKRFIKALCSYVINHGMADNVAGILVSGGDSCEWVKSGPMEDWASDYSKPMQIGFSKWLKEKYETVENLRAAWHVDNVNFEDELVPSPEMQGATDLFLFKDPSKRRWAVDYYEYVAHRVAYDITELCSAVKEATDGNWIAGAFYGYLQEMVWNNGFFGQGDLTCDTEHSAAARSGHAGLAEVLENPNIDFICSPYGYGFRGIGGEGGFMSPYESVRRAGKLWYSEEDTRTPNWDPDSGYGQAKDEKELIEILKRQFSNILVHQSAAWWCDWTKEWLGSYDFPDTMKLFKRLVQLGEHNLTLEHRETASEIAIVIDATSSFYRTTCNNIDIPNWRARGWAISRMGAPVDYVLLSDVLSGKAKEYKMYYMLNCFHISAEDRVKLKGILERDGKTTLWIYAPGYADDEKIDVENVRALTGMNVIIRERRWSVNIMPSNFDDPIMAKLPTSMFWGTDNQLGPIFAIDTEGTDATPLATSVSQQGRFECGFAIARRENYTYAYSVAPLVPAIVLRELAREAGVHIFCEEDDVFYAGHDYVMLHTVRTGDKHITLPRKADVYNAFTGEKVAENVTEFTDHMQAGTTTLWYFGDKKLPEIEK